MPVNERPGVYTSYEVSSSLTARGGGGAVGIAAVAASGEAGKAVKITSAAEAASMFGSECALTGLVRVLIKNGAPEIVAVPAAVGSEATTENYAAAFAALMGESKVRYMTCDSRLKAVHAAMKTAIEGAESESCKYRVGFAEQTGTAAALVDAAEELNSERMVLAAPVETDGTPGAVAAALAGVTAGSVDPALPLNGAILSGLGALNANFTDAEINALVRGGVTTVESVNGETSVIRAVTTRTTTGDAADATWRELSTILIVDDVVPSVRDSLRARFARSKNTAQTRGAIRTQVIIELEAKLAAQIIDSYGEVTVQADAADPTVCNVSFEFTVAHGLNRINLVAHIAV